MTAPCELTRYPELEVPPSVPKSTGGVSARAGCKAANAANTRVATTDVLPKCRVMVGILSSEPRQTRPELRISGYVGADSERGYPLLRERDRDTVGAALLRPATGENSIGARQLWLG